MATEENSLEKGISGSRNIIASIILILSIGGIVALAIFFYTSSIASERDETGRNIFNTLLPVITTWVGTVLAFYFGRENFEAASNRYEQIITRLTPDLLDDVLVEQIMIDKETMVSYELNDANKAKKVADIVISMEDIRKSRLPIIENDIVKYIIHKSTFNDALIKIGKEITLKDLIDNASYLPLITSFMTIKRTVMLESLQNELKNKTTVKDIFILDDNNKVAGWLTDTQIKKYLNTKS